MAVLEQATAWNVFEQFERDVCQLGRVGGVLNWDEQVNMPPRGASARGEAKATLAGVLHERICDERFGDAIAELGGDAGLGAFEAARVREARRERDRAVRVPATLVRELALAESVGFEAWQIARAEADFSQFRQPLERLLSLRREEADAVGYEGGERYDALLDQYEPDMRVARLEPLLHGLRDELVPFVQEIAARPRPDDAFVHRAYATQTQRAVGARLAAAIGFDFEAGRLDEAAHPFAAGFAPGAVRLTTREHENDLFAGLFAVLHEAGHGLYEQGLTGAIEGTFCGNVTSLGLHESQSRFWENMVGRSRAFWERNLEELRRAFPCS
jgi:carboxypeptidase Taq